MSASPPAVSVVVPLYNTREYVAEALDSALGQTAEALEVVVVDDGSTDGGGAIVQDYAERDPRVRYVRQENAGLAAARNTGIELARAEAIAFLDSDDRWLPAKLERQLPLVGPNAVVHSDAFILRPGSSRGDERVAEHVEPPDEGDPFGSLLEANRVAVLTAVVPRPLLLAHGCFDPALRSAEDYDLWLRLAAAGVEFRYVPEPLAVYRIRPGALSSDPVWMAEHRLRVYRKSSKSAPPGRGAAVRARLALEQRLLAGELRVRGRRSIAEGDARKGRRDLARSVRIAPLWWRSWLMAMKLALPFVFRSRAIRHDVDNAGRGT